MASRLQPLRMAIEAVDKATAPIRRIERRLEGMRAPISRLQARLRALDRASGFRALRRGIAAASRGIWRATRAAAALAAKVAAVGLAATAGGLVALRKMAQEGDRIAKAARRIGVSAEALQRLEYAAARSGASTEELGRGLEQLGLRLGKAKAGTGELVSQLRRTNPELLRQLTTATDAGEAFELLAGAIASEGNAARRAFLANSAFGEAGLKLLPLLQEGPDGLRRLGDEAERLGRVMSTRTTTASEAFEDAMTDASSAAAGLRNAIGAGLLPSLTPLIRRATEFVVANRALVATKVQQFLAEVGKAARAARPYFEALAAALPDLLRVGQKTAQALAPLARLSLDLAKAIGPSVLATLERTAALLEQITTAAAAAARAVGQLSERLAPLARLTDAASRFGFGATGGSTLGNAVLGPVGGAQGFTDLLGGLAGRINRAVTGGSAPGAPAQTNVGGRVRIEVLDGRLRVNDLQSTNQSVPLDLMLGRTLSPAG